MDEAGRCRILLDMYEQGPGLRGFLYRNRIAYLLHGLLLIAVLLLGNWAGGLFMQMAILMSGMLLGSLLRDVGWFLRIRQGWPLTVRITDWQRVRAIASGNIEPA